MDGRCNFVRRYLLGAPGPGDGRLQPVLGRRDYLGRVDRIRASVFLVHGLNDFNVKTKAFAEWWYRLARARIPRKLWLHNGGHGPARRPRRGGLPGRRAPLVRPLPVRRAQRHRPRAARRPCSARTTPTRRRPTGRRPARGRRLALSTSSAQAPGELSRRARGRSRQQTFADRGRELDTDDVLIQGPDAASPNRLVYRTAPLAGDVRLSGTPWVKLRARDRQPHGGEPHGRARRLLRHRRSDGHARLDRPAEPRTARARSRIVPGREYGLRLRPTARRPRVPGRPPDRARGRLHRPRLHDPASAGDEAHARPGERLSLPLAPRRGRSSLTNRVAMVSSRWTTPSTMKNAVAVPSSVKPKTNGEAIRPAASR